MKPIGASEPRQSHHPIAASGRATSPMTAVASIGSPILSSRAVPSPLEVARDRETSYALLVEQHSVGVFRLVYGMVSDRAAAEDLTQDAFLRAYELWHQLRSPDGARGWLFTIAANLARQHLRRQRRWSWLPIERWEANQGGRRPHAADAADDAASPILVQLKPDDRTVLVLMGLLDLTAVETASVLGIRTAAVHKRWQRACARFRAISAVEDSHAL